MVACASYFLFSQLKGELAPIEDQGNIYVMFRAPEGATIEYTDAYAKQLEQIYLSVPEADRVFVVAGNPTVSQGTSVVRLKPWGERERTQQEIAKSIAPRMVAVPGVVAFPSNPPSLGQSLKDKPINFVIQTSSSYAELQKMVEAMLDKARDYPGLVDVDTDLKLNSPQLDISVDREKAAATGVEIDTLGRTLETMLGGRQVTRFKQNGEQYDVVVKIADIDRQNPDDMRRIYVKGRDNAMIPLSNLISIKETVAPKELNHFNQLRAATLTAQLAPGYTLSDGLAFLDQAAKDVLPATAHIEYSGQSREFKEASASMYLTFLLALAFIYLVLAAQFESFTDPFIIMLTVPLSITGALLALWWSGGTLNIYSQVGLVTLIGLITKHGILIVEFANQLRAKGQPMREAVIEAATLRLRPILMTTGAMVLGAVPLALATGAGAESRQDIGWVIVGGLLVGTLFTLFVIPVVYTYLSRRVFIEADDDAARPIRCRLCPRRAESRAARSNRPNRDARLQKRRAPARGVPGLVRIYTERTTDPDRTQLGNYSMPSRLWQFFDGSLSVSSIATSVCGRAFTSRDASRTARVELQRLSSTKEFPAPRMDLVRGARRMHNG